MFEHVRETGQLIYTMARLANRRRRRPEQLLAYQRGKLRQLLYYAIAHSPFYRRRFARIDPENCPLERLPITNKEEIMAHFDEVVTDRRIRLEEVEEFRQQSSQSGSLISQPLRGLPHFR
jgi:phenylacetate-CoA ligase